MATNKYHEVAYLCSRLILMWLIETYDATGLAFDSLLIEVPPGY